MAATRSRARKATLRPRKASGYVDPYVALAASRTLPPAADACGQLQGIIVRELERLEGPRRDKKLTAAQRAKIVGALGNAIAQLGRITGETLEISPSKLVRLPAFRRVTDVLLRALEPWPEAMRAAGLALQESGHQEPRP